MSTLVPPSAPATSLVVAPPTIGEPLDTSAIVTVSGQNVPLYPYINRATAPTNSGRTTGVLAGGQFSFSGAAHLSIKRTGLPAESAVVYSIFNRIPVKFSPTITNGSINFSVTNPGFYHVVINGDWANPVHIRALPLDTDAPSLSDPTVMVIDPGHNAAQITLGRNQKVFYFRAGQHWLDGVCNISVPDNCRVYMEDGAFLRAGVNLTAHPVVGLFGINSTLTGRGIIDCSAQPGNFSIDAFSIKNGVLTVTTALDPHSSQIGGRFSVGLLPAQYSYIEGQTFTISNVTPTTVSAHFLHPDVGPIANLAGQGTIVGGLQYAVTLGNPYAVVRGITVRDSPWITFAATNQTTGNPIIDWCDALGHRLNSDGFHFDSVSGGVGSNLHAMTFDDNYLFNNNSQTIPCPNNTFINCMSARRKAHAVHIKGGWQQISNCVVDGLYIYEDQAVGDSYAIGVDVNNPVKIDDCTITNVTAEQCQSFFHAGVQKDIFSAPGGTGLGSINGVTLSNMHFPAPVSQPPVVLEGASETADISNLTFTDVMLGGEPLNLATHVKSNAFATAIEVKP